MSSTWDTVGVVHLRDLVDRSRWDTRKLTAYLDRLGLVEVSQKSPPGQISTSSLLPPKRLLVLNRDEDSQLLRQFRAWLSQTAEFYVAICYNDETSPEQRRRWETEALEALSGLPAVRLAHWEKGRDAPQDLQNFLKTSRLTWPSPLPLRAANLDPPGPWIPWPELLAPDPECHWPRWVCRRDDKPSIYLPRSGRFLDLTSGTVSESVGPPTEDTFLTVWPDGSRLVSSNFRGNFSALDLQRGQLSTFQGPTGTPLGFWPGQPLGWAGHRCTFSWVFHDEEQGGTLSACDHDWPCGHEKKQYGHLNNEPCWIQLSPLSDAYLSVYQKDAVISQDLPVGWRSYGEVWAATAEPGLDSTRALFFVYEEEDSVGDPQEPEDGDARDERPVIALGPDPTHRYALGLHKSVYRVAGHNVTKVNEPFDGYAVFDAKHQAVRYGNGRLLGGWGHWLTGLSEGVLWREDVVTGRRFALGSEQERIDWSFPVPGSSNLILVSDTEHPMLRLV